ncbi:hypothetical protein BsWGS_25818 [Bradybaena similaris]
MLKFVLILLIVLSAAILEVTCNPQMLSPPERPREFKNPSELRQYLKELNEYYAIMGRPRFGKRNGAVGNFDYLSQNDLEDILSSQ